MMEAKFGDISMTHTRIVYMKWESTPLESIPSEGTVDFSWKDQGWGNHKGRIFLMLMSAAGEEKASQNLTNHISPHEWESINVQLVATDPVLAEATPGDWYQVKADCTRSPGHELYVKDLVLRLTAHVPKSTEHSFGDSSLTENTTMEGPVVDYTPTAGTITCTWKDQGWGNWKGKLHLTLLAPDGAQKVTYIVPGVAPHEPEDLEVVLVETDAVLAEATSGCKYQITALVGAGGGHELHLTNLVLRLSGTAPVQTELPFVDVSIAGSNALLKWNSEDLQTAVTSGSIHGRWKDQGSGAQKGKLYLKLMGSDGSDKASFTITENFSPHEWEDVHADLVATDPVLAEATAGCWYQLRADCSDGGGHKLYVEGFVLQLTAAG